MCTDGPGRDAPAGWIGQLKELNELLKVSHNLTAKVVGERVTDESTNIKMPEQHLADTLGTALNSAVSSVRALNAQLNQIIDKF